MTLERKSVAKWSWSPMVEACIRWGDIRPSGESLPKLLTALSSQQYTRWPFSTQVLAAIPVRAGTEPVQTELWPMAVTVGT